MTLTSRRAGPEAGGLWVRLREVLDGGQFRPKLAAGGPLANAINAGIEEFRSRQELAQLRAENRRLREDVEILKRATAFFAKETR